MGLHDVSERIDPEKLRVYTRRVLRDFRALEHMIAEGVFETGTRHIGMEQEMVLADRAWRPAPVAPETLARIEDPRFTTELARFNMEANIDPLELGGDCFSRLEAAVREVLAIAREAAAAEGADVVLTGILPTIRQTDLDLDNMAPVPRYFALNAVLRALRGSEFDLRLSGIDEINVKHDSLMLESCNTSCQLHLQVTPEEFAKFYNIAQLAAGPILAAACNSPFLFGKRLWNETRIAVFQQSIDTRMPAHHIQDRSARVSFGTAWVKDSILEIYEEDIARFRVIMGLDEDVDPFEELEQGCTPKLLSLSLHNSTVYRWNRPCYGVGNGKPHLRIENRVLPAGPTIQDEVANAVLWHGVVLGLAEEHDDITQLVEFDTARSNFAAAVRSGLDAQLAWIDGQKRPAPELVSETLLPLARIGLAAHDIDPYDVERYLGLIENRVAKGQTGAEWMLRSYAEMLPHGTKFECLRALVGAMSRNEKQGLSGHEWPMATIHEAGGWKQNFQRVGQYMTTDLFTVHEDEVVDLIANVMSWRSIRHVPVEDDEHHLVGLVSYRALLHFVATELPHHHDRPVAVSEIMQPDPPTVTPDTTTLDAIALMRREEVACLPVVKEKRLVGIISEHDFMNIAEHLLEDE